MVTTLNTNAILLVTLQYTNVSSKCNETAVLDKCTVASVIRIISDEAICHRNHNRSVLAIKTNYNVKYWMLFDL